MHIPPCIHIEDSHILLEFIRASGPGGQNVNKVSTAVRLRVRLEDIHGLGPEAMARLATLAGKRLNAAGELVLRAEAHRTQDANRRAVLERLAHLIAQAAMRPRDREPTTPTRASRERRLASKARRSQIKILRRVLPE